MANKKKTKRYSLVFPESLFEEMQQVADDEQVTLIELFRKYVKLGLIVTKMKDNPDISFVIREGNREREILLI